VNDLFVDVGVCHYLTIFKTPCGQLVQFDFGPRGGGDISLGPADRGRMARLFKKNKCRQVPAEIREVKVSTAPPPNHWPEGRCEEGGASQRQEGGGQAVG